MSVFHQISIMEYILYMYSHYQSEKNKTNCQCMPSALSAHLTVARTGFILIAERNNEKNGNTLVCVSQWLAPPSIVVPKWKIITIEKYRKYDTKDVDTREIIKKKKKHENNCEIVLREKKHWDAPTKNNEKTKSSLLFYITFVCLAVYFVLSVKISCIVMIIYMIIILLPRWAMNSGARKRLAVGNRKLHKRTGDSWMKIKITSNRQKAQGRWHWKIESRCRQKFRRIEKHTLGLIYPQGWYGQWTQTDIGIYDHGQPRYAHSYGNVVSIVSVVLCLQRVDLLLRTMHSMHD